MTELECDAIGQTLEDFLAETGDRGLVYPEAAKAVVAWQLEQARKRNEISKTAMAEAMGSSRSQLQRVLDPQNVAVSIELLDRAARAVGKRLRIELDDAA